MKKIIAAILLAIAVTVGAVTPSYAATYTMEQKKPGWYYEIDGLRFLVLNNGDWFYDARGKEDGWMERGRAVCPAGWDLVRWKTDDKVYTYDADGILYLRMKYEFACQ